MHPEFVGKVVAEAHAGVNRKSRCIDAANEQCQEGQQMISVIRVFYMNTPVMYDPNSRFPKHIHFLDQAEGLSNTPILWCVSHLIEVPPLDQITRLLGEFIHPSSQMNDNNDSDFEESMQIRKPNSKALTGKDNRKGRNANVSPPNITTSKGPQGIRKS